MMVLGGGWRERHYRDHLVLGHALPWRLSAPVGRRYSCRKAWVLSPLLEAGTAVDATLGGPTMTAQVLRLSTCCKAMPKAFQPQTCSRCQKRATFTLQPKPGYEPEEKGKE